MFVINNSFFLSAYICQALINHFMGIKILVLTTSLRGKCCIVYMLIDENLVWVRIIK